MNDITYPYVIVINGKPETLFRQQDFELLLREHMGDDAERFFDALMAEKDAEIEERNEELRAARCEMNYMEDELSDLRRERGGTI